MAKKRRRTLPLNYYLLPPEVPESGPVEVRLKAYFRGLDIIQQQKKRSLDGFKLDYEETGNPLAVWDAYQFVRENSLPLPEWILKYLDGTAKRLMRTDNKANKLDWCFGFDSSGGSGPWKQYKSYRERIIAISYVIDQINKNDGKPMDDIFRGAAQCVKEEWGTDINFETVKQWFYRNAEKWKKDPVRDCTARIGYPTIIEKENHGLLDGDIVTLSGATGKDATLLNGKDSPVIYATKNTFAVKIDTTNAAPMGNNITVTP